VSQGGALGVLEAEVRMQEKPLVVLCTRGEIKPDAIAEEATKKTPADASCIKCVRVTTWDSHPCTEAAQVQSGLAARRSTLSTAPSKGLAHGVKWGAARGGATHHETRQLQLYARGDMYSRQHSMIYEHVHNIRENIHLLLNLAPNHVPEHRFGSRGASAHVYASTPILAASVRSSVIAEKGRTAPTPTARAVEGGEGLNADVGEEDTQAGVGDGVISRASHELPRALAERCSHVRPIHVHLNNGRVCIGFQASRRRSAARGLRSCFCMRRWSYGWRAALVTLSSGRRVKCRVWI
jgi:hypothetical protein